MKKIFLFFAFLVLALPPVSAEVNPSQLTVTVFEKETVQTTFVVANSLGETCSFEVMSHYSFLSFDPSSFVLEDGDFLTVTLTVDGNHLTEGSYRVSFRVKYNNNNSIQGSWKVTINLIVRKKCDLTVKVLDAETLNPLVDAEVDLNGDYSTTDSEGEAVFSGVPDGSYTIRVCKLGYFGKEINVTLNENKVIKVLLVKNPSSSSNENENFFFVPPSLPDTEFAFEVYPGENNGTNVVVTAEGGTVKITKIIPKQVAPNWLTVKTTSSLILPNETGLLSIVWSVPNNVELKQFYREFLVFYEETRNGKVIENNLELGVQLTVKPPPIKNVSNLLNYPQVFVRINDEEGVSPSQNNPVSNGSKIYVEIKGNVNDVEITNSGGVNRYNVIYKANGIVYVYSVSGSGKIKVFLVGKDQYGNKIKTQPQQNGFGDYIFTVTKPSLTKLNIYLTYPSTVSVGQRFTVSAIVSSLTGSEAFNGVLILFNHDSGEKLVIQGANGVFEGVVKHAGVYKFQLDETTGQKYSFPTGLSYNLVVYPKVLEEHIYRVPEVDKEIKVNFNPGGTPLTFKSTPTLTNVTGGSYKLTSLTTSFVGFIPKTSNRYYTLNLKGRNENDEDIVLKIIFDYKSERHGFYLEVNPETRNFLIVLGLIVSVAVLIYYFSSQRKPTEKLWSRIGGRTW